MLHSLRLATLADADQLEALIGESVRTLQAPDYSAEQREGALGTVFGVDRQLIADGTYFVVQADQQIVACGGWSRRRTLFGSDHGPVKDNGLLNPATDAARVRAFFVHPAWARRGLGRMILHACEAAASREGFHRLELAATLTGIPLYRSQGFQELERVDVKLPNGAVLPIIRMGKTLPSGSTEGSSVSREDGAA